MTIAKKQCMVYLKVAEAVLFPAICGRSLVPRLRNSTQIRLGTRLSWPRIHGARIRVQSTSASHSHSTGIVPRRWNKVWERDVSVLWTPLVATSTSIQGPLHTSWLSLSVIATNTSIQGPVQSLPQAILYRVIINQECIHTKASSSTRKVVCTCTSTSIQGIINKQFLRE